MRIACLLPTLLLLAPSGPLAHAQAVARINHVAFFVAELQPSADFYRDVVGLEPIPEPFKDGRHAWFLIGPKTHLHIISGAEKRLPTEKRSHLCFTVPSVDEFRARLTARGIVYENLVGQKNSVTVRPDGVKQIYFQDPDGNWLEINDAKD
ncbi:MAG TPA: VOC family protein [Opitutaceae bacterium]|nr:VOC family protein [Opitutaceae bacterium]